MPPTTPGLQGRQVDDPPAATRQRPQAYHAEIHDTVRLQLERGAAGDDLALRHLHDRDRGGRYAQLAGECRAVRFTERLHVVFDFFRDDDAIDQDPGDLYLPRVEGSTFGDALDLCNHHTAGIARCHRDREAFEQSRAPS